MPEAETDLARRLEAFLGACEGGEVRVADLERLHGGAARETWRFRAVGPQGDARRLVLRRDPPSTLITTSRAVEFHALARAHAAGLPVPRPLHLAMDPEILGAPGFVMEEVLGGRAAGLFEPEPYGAQASLTGADVARALGRLHALEPDAADRAVLPHHDAAGVLAYWAGEIERHRLGPEPVAMAALRWLERHLPAPSGPPALVHGDFRSGNFLVDGDNRLLAILDWEMAHIGDPLEDLAWLADPLWSHGDPRRAGAMRPWNELVPLWEEASGRRFRADLFAWWRLFAGFKGLAIWITSAREVVELRAADPVLAFSALWPYRAHAAEIAALMVELGP
ncbi:MAG: phosphotransferase family protein [Sphingomonadaceae bacterium]|uniref:phosphotransferase family protein n=1 Tax=Thermaurantiacus sp. TaxID=2820283 RepID=UPI00298EDBA1|nr:phosphotransferase family protein [Thermaurantiacus sp.]MCS6985989.1 phosphotransferase family protein [Sphingomonadaceae bacterium]MDW8414795.1 phosphotransferase family protein [Thermaurantiacus sp.]